MQQFLYHILRFVFLLISKLPFGMLYRLSDLLFLLVYHVARYRRRLVWKNLQTSFPEKDTDELKSIERDFYHFFCDYLHETIKLLSISKEELEKHVEFRNLNVVEDYFEKGRDCAGILGHYGNWEWLSTTNIGFRRYRDAVIGLIFHPLYNKAFNQLFLDIRQSTGGICIPKQNILRYLLGFKREGRKSLVGYISDQGPKWENIHLWLDFLNHETPVFTGAERIMKKMNNVVFYVDMERPQRGKYIFTFRLLTDKPQEQEEHAITRLFFQHLEQSIRREPRFYLWTHDRWKRTHKEFDERFKVENGHVLPRTNNDMP